jgi:hypothetical protein
MIDPTFLGKTVDLVSVNPSEEPRDIAANWFSSYEFRGFQNETPSEVP